MWFNFLIYIVGTVLGIPLTPYKGYNSALEPVIDTFFASVTFRYGHSEVRYKDL